MTTHLATRIELHLQCLNLKNSDTLSKNDPFVVVYSKKKPVGSLHFDFKDPLISIEIRSGVSDAEIIFVGNNTASDWQEFHRTATIQNNNNPEWAENVEMDYHFEEVQELRFEVYDRDSSSEKLTKHDYLGWLETKVSKIMGSKGTTVSGFLKNKRGKAGKGRIVVTGKEKSSCADIAVFKFRAEKLARKNMMGLGKSDPFYVISCRQPNGSFHKVFSSETVKANLNPQWKSQAVPLRQLNNGEMEREIKIDVFDHEGSGNHKHIGCFFTSLTAMQPGSSFNLTTIKTKKAQGVFTVVQLEVQARSSFLNYVQGGCELRMLVAIDFTASNKPPSDPDSLHHLTSGAFRGTDSQISELNEYEKAILSVGQILEDYDSDKMIGAYGFGANLQNGMDKHCFPLTLDASKPEVCGVDGLIQAYHHCLKTVGLSGPTRFSNVVKEAMRAAGSPTQNDQYYTVLLILTDGVINDMSSTIENIVKAASKPLSIIIVGVGNADFEDMETLDGDKEKLSFNGKSAVRDIVQFVPFSKFYKKSYTALAEETLKEVPQQMTQYFLIRSIKANPPQPPTPVHYQMMGSAPDGAPEGTPAEINMPVAAVLDHKQA